MSSPMERHIDPRTLGRGGPRLGSSSRPRAMLLGAATLRPSYRQSPNAAPTPRKTPRSAAWPCLGPRAESAPDAAVSPTVDRLTPSTRPMPAPPRGLDPIDELGVDGRQTGQDSDRLRPTRPTWTPPAPGRKDDRLSQCVQQITGCDIGGLTCLVWPLGKDEEASAAFSTSGPVALGMPAPRLHSITPCPPTHGRPQRWPPKPPKPPSRRPERRPGNLPRKPRYPASSRPGGAVRQHKQVGTGADD